MTVGVVVMMASACSSESPPSAGASEDSIGSTSQAFDETGCADADDDVDSPATVTTGVCEPLTFDSPDGSYDHSSRPVCRHAYIIDINTSGTGSVYAVANPNVTGLTETECGQIYGKLSMQGFAADGTGYQLVTDYVSTGTWNPGFGVGQCDFESALDSSTTLPSLPTFVRPAPPRSFV